ncbi:MAG: hypothetical protein RL335_1590 [Bacteroidota bacterium]|jgi:hypothetical protein
MIGFTKLLKELSMKYSVLPILLTSLKHETNLNS